MHMDAAGIPTAVPKIIRVAATRMSFPPLTDKKAPTYVTPHRRSVPRIARPNDRVHEPVRAPDRGPEYVVADARVPRVQVPDQGNQSQQKAKDSGGGEERLQGVGHSGWRARDGAEAFVLLSLMAVLCACRCAQFSIQWPKLAHNGHSLRATMTMTCIQTCIQLVVPQPAIREDVGQFLIPWSYICIESI